MKITLTAGHSNTDPGNTWGGESEAFLVTNFRNILAQKLTLAGHTVRTDGAQQNNHDLRAAMALIRGSDLAIELHTNASNNTTATGVEIIARPEHAATAQRIAAAVSQVLGIPLRRDKGWYPHAQATKDRGFEPGFSRAGGHIVELFFQSNQADLAAFKAREWMVASAITAAINTSALAQAQAAAQPRPNPGPTPAPRPA